MKILLAQIGAGHVALALFLTGIGAPTAAAAPCRTLGDDGQPNTANQDALARVLATRELCPRNVPDFRALVKADGGRLVTTFVGNRGFHNPGAGSFSLFEMVAGELSSSRALQEGDFFFGHFTEPRGNTLALARQDLIVEAIAWDATKGMFNFYELTQGSGGEVWHYKGDSAAILADTELLHRRRALGQSPFGPRLRCSGCHVNGGPIMKELAGPHNDWWQPERHLPLGGRGPDATLAPLLDALVSADVLAAGVKAGVARLNASPQFRAARAGRTLQERLRPLFCPVELNLESDGVPLDGGPPAMGVPAALFVDPRLAQGALSVSRDHYLAALQQTGSRFPEITGRRDADHAWLGPVKAASDQAAVQTLVDEGVIDDEFVSDVLAVDFTNPALSDSRCRLLKLLPAAASPDFQTAFVSALRTSTDAAAKELHRNRTEAGRNAAFHRQRAESFLTACGEKLKQQAFVTSALRLLAQRRAAVGANEISRNPRGQILEPGFRVVFPVQAQTPRPGELKLSESCEITQ